MTNYALLLNLLREKGMDYKWSKMFVKKLSDDEQAFNISPKKKEWAIAHGFFPGRVELYGLNDENFMNYLPDYCYFMIHPINNHFKIWVNDKLTLKYVLNSNSCIDTMPDYYLYVENDGSYTYLMDESQSHGNDAKYIRALLEKEGILAIKPNSGTSGGMGFLKIEDRGGEIYVNNAAIEKLMLDTIVSNLRNHIVTEYIHQNDELAKIWPSSECTLRVIMVKIPKTDFYLRDQWHCIVSYARFGSIVSGGASNLSSGGIGIGFDFRTGKFKEFGIRYKKFCDDGNWILLQHPDTNYIWKGQALPNWEFVKNKIVTVCHYLSSLEYLGFDIIITNDGMKICEINTHPAADYEQVMCSPILADEKAKTFFRHKGLFQIKNKEFYEIYRKSQVDK